MSRDLAQEALDLAAGRKAPHATKTRNDYRQVSAKWLSEVAEEFRYLRLELLRLRRESAEAEEEIARMAEILNSIEIIDEEPSDPRGGGIRLAELD